MRKTKLRPSKWPKASWSEHFVVSLLQQVLGRSGHRSYKVVEFVGQGTTGFVLSDAASASQDIPRIRLLQDSVVASLQSHTHTVVMETPSTATPRPPQRRCRSSYVSSRQRVQPVCSSEQQTVLLINQSKGCWNIIQNLRSGNSYNKRGCENHHIPQTWNQPSWEYVHSTTIKNSSKNYQPKKTESKMIPDP